MPYSKMDPKEVATIFGAGLITRGLKRMRKTQPVEAETAAPQPQPEAEVPDSPPSSEGRWVLTPLTDEQIEAVMKDIQENCDPTKM